MFLLPVQECVLIVIAKPNADNRNAARRILDTTWPIVVNQIEHNETAREETQPAEMEEVQPVNETQAREQLKTGLARARKKPGWLKDFVI